ncbi:Aste57867_22851 [Aphanomyces stellatus]|uniref:Aste57867_22851 protein n=1 Tax=Aphanomyces stellatus TaxID=120398 RepID=A0A485LN10_9STRA|nr:hypothetical protein As57867_022780 [Aphanomyces stellatus]VFT99502.1 Aste57867_22851 [Aphanomyces stellatus]
MLDSIRKAATWTDVKLRERIDTFISDEDAQDLVMRILVLEPGNRLSANEAMDHPYFTGIRDTSAFDPLVKEFVQNQKAINSKMSELSRVEVSRGHFQEQATLELNAAIYQLGHDAVSRLLETIEVTVPTSFVALPCKLLTGDNVNATKMTSFLAQLWDTGKKLQAAKGSSVSAIVSELNAGDPLYLYLMDEDTGDVVVPDANDPVYPIIIPTRDDSSFLLINLPFIQSTFKRLQKGTAVVGRMQLVHDSFDAQHKTKNWTKEVEQAIEQLSEPTSSFPVLQQVLDVEEPLTFVRGAALLELKQWFAKHDPSHSFAGLKPVISHQGHVMWTSEARALAIESEADKSVAKTYERIREKFKQTTP